MCQFLQVKHDIGLCPQRSRCAQCAIIYMSNSTSACVRTTADVRNVLIFTGPIRHRQMSAMQPMCAMYHFLQVKFDIGWCLQRSRCAQCANFYRSNSTSASVRNAAYVRNLPIFTSQTRHRLVPATQPMCAMYQFLHAKLDIGLCPRRSRCAPNPIF